MHDTHIIATALIEQEAVEFLEGGHPRHGHQKIAAAKPHTVFYPSLLMPLTRGTKVTAEQVVTAKGDERPLLFAVASLNQRFDCRRQIVVTEPMRHAAKVLKGAHMPLKKRFLLLRRKGHHEAATRVVEPHHADLHGLLHPGQNHLGFSPVHLRILPWLKFQG